jgi:hypothetical protein
MKTVVDESNPQGKSIREQAQALGRTMEKYKGRASACNKILDLTDHPAFGR